MIIIVSHSQDNKEQMSQSNFRQQIHIYNNVRS